MILTPKNWTSFQHYKDRAPQWIKLHRTLLDDYEFATLPVESRALAPMLWLLASEFDGGRIKGSLDSLAFRFHMKRGDLADALNPLIDAGFFSVSEVDVTAHAEQVDTLSQRIAKSNGFGSRHISDATKRTVWERDGGKCCSCGSLENLEYDHKHPVSKGGTSEEGNIQLLCRPCNRRKRVTVTTAHAEQVDTHTLSLRSLEKEGETQVKIEKEGENCAVAKATRTANEKFEEFWKAKPRRAGADPKAPAEKLFLAAVKAGTPADEIIGAAKRWAIADAGKIGTEYLPQAVKWLRDRRWNDYPPGSQASLECDRLSPDDAIDQFIRFGRWSRHSPFKDISQVPVELLAKHGLLPDGRKIAAA